MDLEDGQELFPQAIQALDVFHASEKIGDVVADNFKGKKERAHEFRLLKVWLKRGKVGCGAEATVEHAERQDDDSLLQDILGSEAFILGRMHTGLVKDLL